MTDETFNRVVRTITCPDVLAIIIAGVLLTLAKLMGWVQ